MGLDAVLSALDAADKALRAQNGHQNLTHAAKHIDAALAIVDGSSTIEPASLPALFEGTRREAEARGLSTEGYLDTYCDESLPPIPIARGRMQAFFLNALRFGAPALTAGGRMSVLADYDAGARIAGVVISAHGSLDMRFGAAFAASLRRAIEASHQGRLDMECTETSFTLTVALPDLVGRTIDAWIPGWEVFSERSQQMLRLLKSGGQTPPESLILGGVLEDELERWLLPHLSEAYATHMAHELSAGIGPLPPGATREHAEKALGQVRRGKPKKEIAKPCYASTLLWLCRNSEQHRAAMGAERLAPEEIESLCKGLLREPIDYAGCLRLIAKARLAT